MLRNRVLLSFAASCALGLAPAVLTLADEVEDGERCVDTRRISSTEIIDDQNILFHMRGHRIYLNTLPYRCSSLARENRFSYRTTISRLCDNDLITVLYESGIGLTSGPSCGLGLFRPISRDEADALKGKPEIQAEPIPAPEPEDVE